MDYKKVNIRAFMRNYKEYLPVKKPIVITINNKEVGVLSPMKKQKKDEQIHKINVKELEKYMFDGDKDLSKNIDDILYGDI